MCFLERLLLQDPFKTGRGCARVSRRRAMRPRHLLEYINPRQLHIHQYTRPLIGSNRRRNELVKKKKTPKKGRNYRAKYNPLISPDLFLKKYTHTHLFCPLSIVRSLFLLETLQWGFAECSTGYIVHVSSINIFRWTSYSA